MPISFLAPVFLAGLAALAVPILIHLSSRPRKRTVEFPSLMFLERVEYRDSSRRRLRHVLLFALRSLALILLAAAFARPFLDRPDAVAATPDGGREVVVLLDRSASMAAAGRMERARAAVGTVADGLRRGDRATLVLFDRDAAAANRATDQPAELRAAADTAQPGDGATRLASALRLAGSILSGSPLPRRELVVVSDFQRTGWDPDAAPRMPAGTDVRTVPVGDAIANTFVADVRFGRERFSGRERVRVAATVARRGPSASGGAGEPGPEPAAEPGPDTGSDAGSLEVPVALVLDGRPIGERTVRLPATGAATVEFDPVTLPDRAVRGTVRAGSDALPGDNAFHFVLNAGRATRVLIVEPRAVAGAAAPDDQGAPYLARALGVGPGFDVSTVPEGRLGDVALAGVDVVVLNGAEPDPDRLDAFVRAGGGLVVVLGPRSRNGAWGGTGLLPGTVRGTRDAEAGAAWTTVRAEHPVFAPFRSGGGLTGARFYRYRELEPSADAEVLARVAGAPALVGATAGGGRVVVLASTLDGRWNDLVLHPGFVPLAHQLVRWTSGREPAPAWRTVGDLLPVGELLAGSAGAAGDDDGVDPRSRSGAGARSGAGGGAGAGPTDGRAGTDRPVVLTPADAPIPVEAGTLLPLRDRGFYELRDPRADGAVAVAVNGDPAESDPGAVDPEVVAAAVSGGPAGAVAAPSAPEEQERRQSLWWYFLAGAFVLMALETVVSNALSRRPLPATTRESA